MSTDLPDFIINNTAPVTEIDEYIVTAGGIFSIFSNQTNSSGLLANDAQSNAHWQLGLFGGTGMTITSIRLAQPDANDVLVPATISSSLGTWTVSSNGSLAYVADGLESKKLGAGELWRDGLVYTVKNISNGLTSTGLVVMDIIGATDSPEISVGLLPNIQLTEDTWHQLERDESGYVTFAMAPIELVFADNGANLSASASISLSLSDDLLYQKYFDQLQKISSSLSVTFSALWGDKYIFSDLQVFQSDFDFLEAGETLRIAVLATISDGNPFSRASSSTIGVLTIEGVNHPPVATPDSVTVTEGLVLTRESSVSVLANDDDTDLVDEGTLHITGIYSNSGELSDLRNGEATLSTAHGSLTMYDDGTYRYLPFQSYQLTDAYDTYHYVVADGAEGYTASELTIHVLPDPKSVNLVPLETEIFMLDDGLSVIGGAQAENTGLFTSTELGDFYIRSLSESLPDVSIFDLGFSMFSQTNSSELFPTAALLASGTFPSMIWETMSVDDSDIRTWGYSLEFNALSDFRLLNPGDQVWLNYVIRGTGDALYDREQLFEIVIVGDNDAPEAAANYNLVYAGHSAWGVEGSASGLLTNDTDPDYHDVLHVRSIRSGEVEISFADQTPDPFQPLILEGTYGWLYVYSGGSYQYTASKPEAQAIEPVSDTVGPTYETFTYTVVDKWGASDEEQLIIQVLGPDDKPTAFDDELTIWLTGAHINATVINVLENDLSSGSGLLVVKHASAIPDYFILSNAGDLRIDPARLEWMKFGEVLEVDFSYVAQDNNGDSQPATIHATIIGSNSRPEASDDSYFYQNTAGSMLDVSVERGLIRLRDVDNEQADHDIDGDELRIFAVSVSEDGLWKGLDNGQVTLDLPGDIHITVFADGHFTMDTPDTTRGTVTFAYQLFDDRLTDIATASIEIGGPTHLADHLLINEISLMNGAVMRSVYTDNGAAPNRILVGAASIELLNTSDEAISAASLATLALEIVGADGSMTTISLGELTGLTRGASGEALNQLSIPAGGILMLYEPGTLGLGTWALYGPNKSFIAGASGSYAGQGWPLGSTAEEAMAVNLVQNGTSIDFFAANGADTEGLTGIIGLGDSAQGEQGMAGVPWAGDHLGLLSEEQYDGTMSSEADTVFGRTSFTDTDSELDWSHYVFQARTVGDTNTRLSGSAVRFVANPEDPTENLNPNQTQSTSVGQDKQTGSGSLTGGGGHDVLMGQDGSDHLFGDELDDWLHGGGGNDNLEGGSGGDWLQGGAGEDHLTGGSGADLFVYAAVTDSGHSSGGNHDWVMDFTVSEDRIDVSIIDANAGLEGDQAFAWGGLVSGRSQAATMAGLLVYWVENGLTLVQADVVGDDLVPLELIINGAKSLSAADFVM